MNDMFKRHKRTIKSLFDNINDNAIIIFPNERIAKREYNKLVKKMKLELKETSWKNLFDNIRSNEMKTSGNFWTAVQSLERQLQVIRNE